eukprot:284_1
MLSSLLIISTSLLISPLTSEPKYRDEDCPRIRKPFHTLSEDERMLYVTGFQQLRKNGKLEVISTTHAANVAVHKGASFFFLHAYMIWEAETAIRELGPEYTCFGMPYWDYTIDSGLESDPTIFHLNVGGNGIPQNDFCMEDPLWQVNNYWSTDSDTCMNDEIRSPPYCCLKRSVSDTQLLPNVMEIAAVFLKNSNYLLFETQIDHYHVAPHFYLAVNTWSQMATAYAVDDPIFFLLHTFTLYQRALWYTCYEYDKIDANELQNYPNAYTPSCNPNMVDCGVVGIDATYNLYPMNQVEWSLAFKMDITPRILYNIKDWNVKYDLGTFYTNSKLNQWCEFRAMHSDIDGNDVYGPDPDIFVDLTNTYDTVKTDEYPDIIGDLIENNYLQKFIDDTWNELKEKQKDLGLSNDEIYYAVESLSCKYHRSKSENSCYDEGDEIINGNKYETCKSRNIFDKNDINLDDMLGFDGVRDNECLMKRRKQLYGVSNLDDSVKLKLCNGEYDYKCHDWEHDMYGVREHEMMIKTGKLKLVSSYNGNGYNYMILLSICIFIVVSVCFVFRLWFRNEKKEIVRDMYEDYNGYGEREDVVYGTF